MNAATIIALLALATVVFLALRYLIREKRKGNKCIGCPYAQSCSTGDPNKAIDDIVKKCS